MSKGSWNWSRYWYFSFYTSIFAVFFTFLFLCILWKNSHGIIPVTDVYKIIGNYIPFSWNITSMVVSRYWDIIGIVPYVLVATIYLTARETEAKFVFEFGRVKDSWYLLFLFTSISFLIGIFWGISITFIFSSLFLLLICIVFLLSNVVPILVIFVIKLIRIIISSIWEMMVDIVKLILNKE